METVKETTSSAATTVSNAIYGEGQKSTEEHKSMIDDKVTTGTYSGRVETADHAMDTEGTEEYDPAKQKEGSGSAHDAAKGPSGPGGQSKPQGSNVTGTDLGSDTNKNAHSNKDEPNTGFGGSGGEGKGSSAEPSVSAGGAGDKGQPKLPDEKSSEEGTGTEYVKSSGLKAEGGDFDASKPGAGREADRLLEQAGISHGAGGGTAGKSAHGSASDPQKEEKRSIGEKIKEKLHHK